MQLRTIPLNTGVTLNVAIAGDTKNRPIILLHGFPESHRTWREIVPRLSSDFLMIMPDQRGFGASEQPQNADAYETDKLVDDVFALAEAMGIPSFSLVGHDWGGIIAWEAALRRDPRLQRLAIINAPHPVIYQRSLIHSPEQRLAAQYVNRFREPGFAEFVRGQGFDWFFEATLAPHIDPTKLPASERTRYISDWSRPGAFQAMLNWYRAARFEVPSPEAAATVPPWAEASCPRLDLPILVIWGMKDFALMPVQLDGLDQVALDTRIVRLPQTGHFATWEAPDEVASSLASFLARGICRDPEGADFQQVQIQP